MPCYFPPACSNLSASYYHCGYIHISLEAGTESLETSRGRTPRSGCQLSSPPQLVRDSRVSTALELNVWFLSLGVWHRIMSRVMQSNSTPPPKKKPPIKRRCLRPGHLHMQILFACLPSWWPHLPGPWHMPKYSSTPAWWGGQVLAVLECCI